MNCIAIDDEPLALNIIEEFCLKIDFLNLEKKCSSAFEAIEIVNRKNIDLIFLDIHMPDISGLDFFKSIPNPPMVIFTTAYSEFALDGFELNAVDYLVKPIPFNRFFLAVNRAYELFNLRSSDNEKNEAIAPDSNSMQNNRQEYSNSQKFLLIKVEYSTVRVDFDTILYIEGLKDYIKIYTTEKMLLTKSTMKNIQSRLPELMFFRVHKSFIVSFNYIRKIENNRIVIREKYIPIGEQYKEKFYKYVNENRL
jgi:DNA-binding LytR/AlgR family response regulator